MKTNQIMKRQMGNMIVEQRTSDGMFNATLLLNQWNGYNKSKKQINDFLRLKQTDAYINEIIAENNQNLVTGNSPKPDFQVIDKKRGAFINYIRQPDEVWMHPYLFIDFAMWLNPAFKLRVIHFVYDSLLEYRKISSDLYIEMCNATNNHYIRNSGMEAPQQHYIMNAKIIQQLVFNKTFRSNPWQIATEKQLQLRTELQKIFIACYNRDYSMEKTMRLLEAQIEISNLI